MRPVALAGQRQREVAEHVAGVPDGRERPVVVLPEADALDVLLHRVGRVLVDGLADERLVVRPAHFGDVLTPDGLAANGRARKAEGQRPQVRVGLLERRPLGDAGQLDQVRAEARRDGLRHVAHGGEREGGLLERRHHAASRELAQVAAAGAGARVVGVLPCEVAEVLARQHALPKRRDDRLGGIGRNLLRGADQDVAGRDGRAVGLTRGRVNEVDAEPGADGLRDLADRRGVGCVLERQDGAPARDPADVALVLRGRGVLRILGRSVGERDQACLDGIPEGGSASVDGGRVALGRAHQEEDVGDCDALGLLRVEVRDDGVQDAAVGEVGAGELVAVLGHLGDVGGVVGVARLAGGEHLETEVDVALQEVEAACERRLCGVDDGAVGGDVGLVEGAERERVCAPGGDDGRAVRPEGDGLGGRPGSATPDQGSGGDEREQGEAGGEHRVSVR